MCTIHQTQFDAAPVDKTTLKDPLTDPQCPGNSGTLKEYVTLSEKQHTALTAQLTKLKRDAGNPAARGVGHQQALDKVKREFDQSQMRINVLEDLRMMTCMHCAREDCPSNRTHHV